MEYGTVKWFDVKKGYGFIGTDSGQDYFVHWSNIASDGFRKLEDGQRVAFDVGHNERGPLALNVSVVVESEDAE